MAHKVIWIRFLNLEKTFNGDLQADLQRQDHRVSTVQFFTSNKLTKCFIYRDKSPTKKTIR